MNREIRMGHKLSNLFLEGVMNGNDPGWSDAHDMAVEILLSRRMIENVIMFIETHEGSATLVGALTKHLEEWAQ